MFDWQQNDRDEGQENDVMSKNTPKLEFLKQQSAVQASKSHKGSTLVANLNRARSVQIALRLPAPDLAKAREIAARKGIGYQTLLKMLVHEGLRRESRRQ
jgi:predicted DNA binding CopG/RHH family protein